MIVVDYHKDGMYGAWIVDDNIPDDRIGRYIGAVSPSQVKGSLPEIVKWAEGAVVGDESVTPSEICHCLMFDEWVMD